MNLNEQRTPNFDDVGMMGFKRIVNTFEHVRSKHSGDIIQNIIVWLDGVKGKMSLYFDLYIHSVSVVFCQYTYV